MLADFEHDLLLGVGALIAAAGGCLSGWAALVKARNEGSKECEAALHACREESEKMAVELHEIRTKGVILP